MKELYIPDIFLPGGVERKLKLGSLTVALFTITVARFGFGEIIFGPVGNFVPRLDEDPNLYSTLGKMALTAEVCRFKASISCGESMANQNNIPSLTGQKGSLEVR